MAPIWIIIIIIIDCYCHEYSDNLILVMIHDMNWCVVFVSMFIQPTYHCIDEYNNGSIECNGSIFFSSFVCSFVHLINFIYTFAKNLLSIWSVSKLELPILVMFSDVENFCLFVWFTYTWHIFKKIAMSCILARKKIVMGQNHVMLYHKQTTTSKYHFEM